MAISYLEAVYSKDGKCYVVAFNRLRGAWGADLWIEKEYIGFIHRARSTDLDVIIRDADEHMAEHYGFSRE